MGRQTKVASKNLNVWVPSMGTTTLREFVQWRDFIWSTTTDGNASVEPLLLSVPQGLNLHKRLEIRTIKVPTIAKL